MSLECAQKPIKPKDLGRWKLIADFQNRLIGIAERMGIASTFLDPKRQLLISSLTILMSMDVRSC